MVQSDIVIDTDDGPMPAYVAAPAEAPRGAVVVVQEAFGVTSHIRDVADRLAGAGWHAVAPALFHRLGAPAFAYDDVEQVRPAMQSLTAAGITTDLTATVVQIEAAGIPSERIGIVGFCMGGAVALYAATIRRIGAAVTFYGGGVAEGRFGLPSLVELATQLTCPWLGLYGDLDQGIPVEEVETLRRSAAGSLFPTEVVRYADGDHSFHCDDRPAVFNADAASDAWARTLAWFDAHLGG